MYRLPQYLTLFLILLAVQVGAQTKTNPHGKGFAMDCADCHNSGGWDIEKLNWDHASTGVELTGQHEKLDCEACHNQLHFDEAASTCQSCHSDVHEGTVGEDCMRCHTTAFWLVSDVQGIHEENGFPLDGAHFTAACTECHGRANELVFERIGMDCSQCHTLDFQATTQPNHTVAGFGMDCSSCHDPLARDWGGGSFHLFFPLEGGHSGVSCAQCHTTANYSDASPECVSCHLTDFNATTSPNHAQSGFPTDCSLCHDNNISWAPASFTIHDAEYFPIYSGKHQGEWSSCTDCHTNPSNFSLFSCIDCHEHSDQADLADEHNDVSGYIFQSTACFQCHPNGNG